MGNKMVSFDVKALFTNVPVKEALEAVENKKGREGAGKHE